MASAYRDRYDDSRSSVSTTRDRRNNDGSYTKVTRYIVKDDDDDTRSNYTTRSRRPEERVEELRISRREVEEPAPQPRREEPRYTERDLTIRTRDDGPRSPARQSYSWDRRDEGDKELIIRRTVEREEPRREERDLTVTKIEERRATSPRPGYEVASPRDQYYDRDLQHYTRTAEYYAQPQQPQTIIIRQDPIIIRERVRDDDYQMVRKSDVEEERSVVRRDEPRDEEFFYEKRVRERVDPRDQYEDRRMTRRDISPGDSVSQAGRRRDRSYSSDDSMVYVRRKEEYESREPSPDRKKNLAAGVIAGVGAAELIRNHRKKEGKEASSGIGRIGRDVGAGALGALAVEGIQRARSVHRERSRRRDSRDRSWSGDRYERGGRSRSRGRYRSRSRSESHSRLKTLGALGLGAVAVAAAATVASRKMKENKEEGQKEKRRSRSRHRRNSVESLSSLENDPDADDARNPKHRNSRIAAAGAVGAAGAALIERARSKSRARDGERSESRSRVRQGLPIVAAGLGTAALAGLYEKSKAKREAEAIQHEQKKEARSRSRNRSQGRPDAYYEDSAASRSGTNMNDPGLIEYGYGPMAGNNFGPDYYGRPAQPEPYYGASNAVVPAERGPRSRSRSMSRDRRNRREMSLSGDSDGDRRDRRQERDAAAAAAAAAGGAVAAGEYERRKAEKKERKARKRQEERGYSNDGQPDHGYGRDPYEDGFQPQNHYLPTPPPAVDPYASQQGFYNNQTSQYPPPPGSMPQAMPQQYPPAAPTPQPVGVPPTANAYQNQQNVYNPPNAYQPPTDAYGAQNMPPSNQQQNFNPYASGANPYAAPRNRGSDENVSAGNPSVRSVPSDQHQPVPDGVKDEQSRSIDHPPSINIHPPIQHLPTPFASGSIPNLTVPPTYVPPAEKGDDIPHRERKNVQFASSPEFSQAAPASIQTTDSEAASPDDSRQRRRHHETNRGYDASDDTDTMPEHDPRSRAHDSADVIRRRDREERRGSGDVTPKGSRSRDRGHDRGQDRGQDRDRDRDQDRSGPSRDRDRDRGSKRSSKSSRDHGQQDGGDSDSTIELEPRFDEKGRRKTENDDPLASKLDDILAGKGSAGKVLGNFMEGLLGPEGRDGTASSSKDKQRRDSRRARDRD